MNIYFKRSLSQMLVVFALIFSIKTSSATSSWIVPSGNWTTASNWGGGLPNTASSAIIDNGGSVFLTKGSAKAAGLFVGYSSSVNPVSSPSPQPTPTPGTGTGQLTITGGTLSVSTSTLGNLASSTGEVDINKGKWNNSAGLIVGNLGTGIISMAGGTISDATGTLGANGGSTGTFTISSGTWTNTTSVYVGLNGTGVLNLTDKGIVTITGSTKTLNLASNASAVGTLNLGNGNIAGTLKVTTVNGGSGAGTVNFNHTGIYTFAPSLTGILAVKQIGVGTTILTGTNTYVGTTTVNNGTLQIGNGGTTGTLGIGGVIDKGVLAFDRSGIVTISNNISGVGSLQQIGTGTTILTGTNTYSGGTSITKGSLEINADARLGTGVLNINGGGITYGASFNDLRSITIGTGGLTLNTNGFNAVYSQPLTGNGAFTKVGLGQLVLEGTNNYTGQTTISGGTLQVGLGNISSNLGSGKIVNNGSLVYDLSANTTVNNVISGKGQFSQIGTGILTLGGANTYSGGTFIQHNALRLGNAKALGAVTGSLDITTGGSLDLNGFSVTVGALSGSHFSAITSNSSPNPVTFTTSSSISSTFDGTIDDGSGTVALVKAGTGTLTLSSSNTYSGGTTLKAGGVNINNASALGTGLVTIAGPVTLDNTTGAPLTLNDLESWKSNFTFKGTNDLNLGTGSVSMSGSRTVTVTANTLTVGGVISGTSASYGLTKAGSGVLLLLNDNTYGGATGITTGTLQIGNGGTTGSILSTKITDSGKLGYDRSDDISIAAVVSGKGTTQQAGTGMLTLTGANSYTGGTLISGGILQAGNAKALGNGLLFIASAELDLNGFSTGVTSIAGAPGAEITNTGATLSTLTSTSSILSTYAGTISDGAGGVALVLAGKGTLQLPGHNTYSGGTTLKAGELDLGNSHAIGTGTLTIGGGTLDNTTGGPLTLTSNNAQKWDGNFTFNGTDDLNLGTGAVVMSGSRTVTVSAGTLTEGGAISGTNASYGLTKMGPGNLILDGDTTYGGTTTISQGNFQIGEGGAVNSLSTKAIVNNGALIFDTSSDLFYRGVISGKGALTQNGSGLIALSGVNSYSGGTTVNDGTLRVLNFKALGSTSGSLTIATGAVLEMNTGAIEVGTLSGAGILSNFGAQNGTFTTTSTANSIFSGQIMDTAPGESTAAPFAFVKGGSGTLTLTGTNTYTGGTTISAGKLQLGNGGATGTIVGDVVNNGILAFDYSTNKNFDGVISGKGSVHQTGVGSTLTLTATNTYTGGTTVDAGTALKIVDGGTFSTGGVVDNGALFFDYAGDVSIANSISGSGRLEQDGAGTLTLNGSNSYTGGTTITAGEIFLGNAKGLGSVSGNLAVNNGSLDLNGFSLTVGALSGTGAGASIINSSASIKAVILTTNTTTNTTYAGTIEDGVASTTALVKSGTGALTLTGNNTYTGGTTVNAGGSLIVGGGSTTGAIAGNVVDKGTLAFARSDTYSYDGQVSGSGVVAQNGPGTLILTGSNTHSGGTTLQAGTLAVGNASALGTGAVTLNGGTLATDGIQTTINVNGNLAWNSNAHIALTLTPDSSSEEVLVGGHILPSGNGALFFDFTPVGLPMGDNSFLIMTVTPGFDQLTPGNFAYTTTDMGFSGNFRITGNELWFDDGYEPGAGAPADTGSPGGIQAVPEPSTYALFALGAIALLAWRPLRRA